MTTLTDPAPGYARYGWLSRAEDWLDSKGKGAWIAVMVLGFVFFWPVGLATLFYMIWSKRMFTSSCSRRHARHRHGFGHRSMGRCGMGPMASTGNSAFDAYKEETLRRLEQEQGDFEAFLERLREAKDKAEFDQFMDDRARRAATAADAAEDDALRDSDDRRDDRPAGL
ncbi:DUF2852 domain-containing protein [Pseudodonghicola flavimaris]|uniref:DUF2852 domain-containing protein n=1 Tax=Pseudodonghicola flavimaris TaxID=3050036 RepID=A0ABT7EVK0_9RHOB|nr:DUF2852 domain-containing protein [Pseudodonghicola flavimaris]MDK3016319.1 DUF2852 domain-containing protein [Pseudodonghicola flavimaris]